MCDETLVGRGGKDEEEEEDKEEQAVNQKQCSHLCKCCITGKFLLEPIIFHSDWDKTLTHCLVSSCTINTLIDS